MKYGLSEKQLEEIIDFIAGYPEVETAVLFGSRALGSFREASDVDIALQGEGVTFALAAKMKFNIEEDSYLPFMFDFVAYPTITNEALRKHIDTKGVVIFRRGGMDWKEGVLGDLINFGNGKSRPKSKGGYPVYGGNGILGYTKEFNYEGQTIVIGRVGAYCGTTYFENQPIWVSDNALAAKPKKGNDAKYLYYLLKNLNLNQYSEGSSHPLVTQTLLKAIDASYSDNECEQKAIASVLSCLDDKIDLLHRQNKTLEAMAETLFRQWFVEEAQEDWEERLLGAWGKIICGKTPSKKNSDFFGGDVPFVKIPDMHDQLFIFHTDDSLTDKGRDSQQKKTIPTGSICVSCIATVGLVSITTMESQTNQQINSLIPNKNKYLYFLYLYMRSSYDLLHSMASGGTTTLNLNTGNFSNIKIPFPGEISLDKFHIMVAPIFEKIKTNQEQIYTLEKLRDTLLPKLMGGEVRVAL